MTEKVLMTSEEFTELMESDFDYDLGYEIIQRFLDATKIKVGFLEAMNDGYLSRHGISPVFDINAENVVDKCSINGDYSLEFKKDGHKLMIVRYSHDEPMGALIILHPESRYEKIRTQVMNGE